MLLSKAKDPAFWQQVRTDTAYAPMIDHLKTIYQNSYYDEIPALKYSARMRFYSDGNRSEFEAPYFRRRAFLASAALLYLIDPEETHYLSEVHQVLWAICDEYTWALPAHTAGTLEDDLTNVDLFNAETGFTLAELCYLLAINEAAYSLAIKAGDNDEPHNHNDVGSFILSTEKGQILCDLGAGTYTRQYFRPETRYTIFCNSSLSHSVPIVNGQPQLPGKEYNGTISHDGNVITIDFAAAYGQPEFTKLIRRLEYFTDKVVLTDSFASDYQSLTERFVTSIKPEVRPDNVVIGGITLTYDPSLVTLSVKEEAHPLHGFKGEMETIYCLDFALKPGLDQIQFTIQI